MKKHEQLASAAGFYLALPFLYLVSWLPFRLLYLCSDLLYLLVYRLAGYRKQVVSRNLEKSLPGKTTAEIERIRREFYHNFCDISLETLKLLSLSPRALEDRVKINGLSLLESCYRDKTSVILVMGHLGNWEWAGARFSLASRHRLCCIYHPLRNRRYDGLMQSIRTRFGATVYPMRDTYRRMLLDRDELTATAFIADQAPPSADAHWMIFLHQETAVYEGTETLAQRFGYPVFYASVNREGRGRYRIDIELLLENPEQAAKNEITELHTRRLEQDILNDPGNWLWSHRRWKHQRPGAQHSDKHMEKT